MPLEPYQILAKKILDSEFEIGETIYYSAILRNSYRPLPNLSTFLCLPRGHHYKKYVSTCGGCQICLKSLVYLDELKYTRCI